MTRKEIEEALAVAVDDPKNGGFWWPGSEMAPIAYRRWTSFPRRNKASRSTKLDRVVDLAKGLHAHFEPEGIYTPINEWIHLAEALAEVLRCTEADEVSTD